MGEFLNFVYTLKETVNACGIHSLTRGAISLGACTKLSWSGTSDEILCSGFSDTRKGTHIKQLNVIFTKLNSSQQDQQSVL